MLGVSMLSVDFVYGLSKSWAGLNKEEGTAWNVLCIGYSRSNGCNFIRKRAQPISLASWLLQWASLASTTVLVLALRDAGARTIVCGISFVVGWSLMLGMLVPEQLSAGFAAKLRFIFSLVVDVVPVLC